MKRIVLPLWAALLALVPPPALAQDAARGARLYLGLPGGEPSCVECHGPDPGENRNALLNAAFGAFVIEEALARASAMGYLTGLLSPADRDDLSAFLALVAAEADGRSPVQVWPWGLEFGRVAAGASAAPQTVWLRNRSGAELALAPRLRPLVPDGAAGLGLAHDCPPRLLPGGECTVRIGLVAGGPGRVQASLVWGDGETSSLRPVGVAATVETEVPPLARWADVAGSGETPSALDLEAAPGAEVAATLSLQNTGPRTMTLGVPAITGPERGVFRLAGGTCAALVALAPNERCTVRVVARAPTAGRREALLQWRNDGMHAAPRVLAVRAVGAAVPPPPPPPPVASPPPAAAPSPGPAPSPAPAVADSGSGGGGCRVALAEVRPDPTLPAAVLLALWLVMRRRVGAALRRGARRQRPA